MKEQEESGFSRGFRAVLAAVLALALSLPVGGIASQRAYADEDDPQSGNASGAVGSATEAADARALGPDGGEIRIAVLSDTHYYPLNYVSDCEDYRTYVGGDPKMLEESGSILDAALQMVREDAPDILVVSGDLTKDGEKLGHEQLAERFQAIEDETATEVFVINGNHDVFNYEDSCTFENGLKESAETTTADDFRQIYANFGYNGDYEAEYFTNPNHGAGEIAGELSYAVDLGNFTLVAVDSGRYSPDAGTGYDSNEHITAGRVDDDLLPWVVEKTREAEAEGDTVIGIMHHGLVPHFSMEDQILSEYVVDNWRDTATAFADAGMRYIFTGHMHANDISQFTSNAGNTITDLETGSLASWMSPVRSVTLTKGEALDDGTARTQESFSVSSESVKSISFKDHTGAVTQIDDFKSYTQQKLYPETLFNNMANGMLRPILQEIGEQGIRPWLAENLPEVDIDALILGAVPGLLEGGMEIELGTGIGRVHVEYRNGGIQLQPSGTAGLIGDMTITDAQILRLVDDVLGKVEARYIDDPDWLLQQVDDIVTKVSNTGVDSLTAEEHTIYDLVFVCLTGHYAGCENPPSWVGDALAYIQQGDIITELIDGLLDDLMPVVNDILSNTSIDTGIAFSGLWKTAIDSVTDDGNLKATLETFGFGETEIRGLIEGLINEYMSPSFLTGMGSLISEIASSMLYDSNFADDAIDSGAPVTITFDGSATAPEPSVDNGLLPTQVTMTLGDDARTERNFRWYTGTNVASGTVQVATDGSFAEGSIVAEVQAASEQVTKPKTQLNLGLVTTYGTQQATKHSASVDGLQPGTTYWYRVGDKEAGYWSDAFQFVTGDAADTDESFTFINVNDSQGMVESDYDVYKNTLAQADGTFPGAAFTVHGGDFVDDGANEDYWTWALDDENGVAQGMSMTPAAGNHEAKSDVEGITDANPIVSHFNLANVPAGQDLSTGVYYSYVYKNATFVVLNTNDLAADESLSQAQYDWAYNTLAGADTEWKIVLMHKSPYSNGPHQSDSDVAAIRSQVDALAAACDVDLVLSGHDHVYNRTPFLMRGEEQDVDIETQTYKGANYETALNPNGTAFVIAGTCGVKNYAQTPSSDIPSKVALDLAVPVYSGITIDGDHLYYRAYRVDGASSTLIDSFAISKAEEEVEAWEQVEDMIAALPEQSDVTLDDKPSIEAARAAYDGLEAVDKEKVSNYDRLQAAERMIGLLESVGGKRTVTVSNHDDFTNAINDPSVGTIITQGTIEFDEGGWFDDGDREIYVTRDVVVRGTGELRFCRFHVQNGATLVLADSVYVNDTRTQGSLYDALNPVEINVGGTLITQDNVSLRTEYGQGGSDEGVAVKLMGSGATAILGSSGTYWGSEAAVLSTASGTTLVINDGTYNAKNANRVVIDTHGDATVNGGTISSMWISGTLRVNGGTFEHQDSASSNWTPLAVSGGNAYITGGEFKTYGGRDGNASIKLENGARVHVLADATGTVRFGDVDAYVGSPSTSDYKNVELGYAKSNGWGGGDGIYRVDGAASVSSVEDIAALNAARMDTQDVSDNGTYMTTVLPDGTSTVFGKYWLYGNGKGAPSGSGIIGSGEVVVYGPTRTIQNNPVEGVTIEGDATRVVDLNQEGADTLRLTGYTTPANAFDNGIEWSSDNEQTASVAAAAGQGVVTIKQAGGANITATSASKPNLSDAVEVIAVKPTLEGPDELDEETDEATFTAGKGFESDAYDGRLSFKYSVSDGTVASIDEETGVLAKLKAGSIKVIATLYLDGKPTGIAVEKDVVCKMKPEISIDDVNALLDVQVTDANEAMASQHGAQTFEELIANAEGENDAYMIGEVYSEDEPAANVLEGAARLFGLKKADKIWKADVTVQSAPYIVAFDEALQLPKGTHSVEGDESKTVTLVWSDGDPSANAAAGWTLADPTATPVAFRGVCMLEPEPAAPPAPTAEAVAGIEGISVVLNGVNELNGDEGNKSHPDMTFAATGENVQPLIAEGFTVGTVADEDGTWTVQVTLDARKYLDAYAQMGTPAYGAHYFAKSTEDGKRSFELVYDKGTESWQLAEGEKPAYGFDITCLTLRPAAAEIYTGGTNENGGHFIDQYVVDGQGEVYAIDDLNALLDEGVTASVKYYDADGGEMEDDTVPGEYTARIDIEGTPQVRTGGEFDETVNVNVGGEAYTFALEPSQLVIRSVSDTDDAERGDFNVDLVDADDVDAVKVALDAAQGGVVAALNDGTTIYFNGNEDVPVADTSDITLFSDNLLPGQREGELIARANEKLGAGTVGEHYDFQYLDLVDQQQSNAWVSSSAGTKVFWKIPDGADPESVKVIHFKGLHRDYEADDEEVSGLIAASEVEAMELAEGTADDGYVSFTVPASGFSPYLMVWEEKGSQPTQQYTVTFDASPGALDAGYDSSVTVTAGGTIASLPTASRTGYEFGGWTANGAAFDSATPVNGNVTATAVWTPKQYEVTLDAQGGTFSNGGDSLAVQATYDATLPAFEQPQRAGWSFEGWFTETTGGTEVAAGSLYQTAGASTYYAHWAPVAAEQVDVTFDAGKGSFDGGASTATVKVPKGGTLSEGDLPEASRAGFALEGWYLDEQLSQKVVLAEEADPSLGIAATVFDGATTLHAKWLEDISEDADISFAGISQPYTGAAVSAVPTFGDGFPESEQGEVQVFYRSGDEPWSSGAPVSVGSYDVRFVYEGSDAYAPFEKEYPAGVVVTPAKLAQTGLSANPAEVPAGTKLADIALVGGAVTRADGTQVAGTWSWIDAAGAVDAAGTYRAVFTPADGAANYQPLYADVQVGVKASEPGTDPSDPDKPGTDPGDPGTNPGGSGDGNQGGSGSDPGQGGSSSGNQSGGSDQGSDPGQGGSSGSDQGSGSKGLAGAGDPLAGMLAGLGAVLAAAFAACVIALRRSRR